MASDGREEDVAARATASTLARPVTIQQASSAPTSARSGCAAVVLVTYGTCFRTTSAGTTGGKIFDNRRSYCTYKVPSCLAGRQPRYGMYYVRTPYVRTVDLAGKLSLSKASPSVQNPL